MNKMRAIARQKPWSAGALAVIVTIFLAFPGAVSAQLPLPAPPAVPPVEGSTSSSGTSATALIVTVLGSTTTLASTGSLANASDALGAEMETASGSLGSADVLHAAAIGSGDYVSSASSLGDLTLSVAGSTIRAAFADAQAIATSSGETSGSSSLDSLSVNGVSVSPSGEANQTIFLGVLQLVLNEVAQSAKGITVNALHITSLDGTIDIVVASASAAVTQ